jgi:hypothetical protein
MPTGIIALPGDEIGFDNSDTSLAAVNVQDAIAEIDGGIAPGSVPAGQLNGSVTAISNSGPVAVWPTDTVLQGGMIHAAGNKLVVPVDGIYAASVFLPSTESDAAKTFEATILDTTGIYWGVFTSVIDGLGTGKQTIGASACWYMDAGTGVSVALLSATSVALLDAASGFNLTLIAAA